MGDSLFSVVETKGGLKEGEGGWVLAPRLREGRLCARTRGVWGSFMGGMVAGEGDFWQWEGGTKEGGMGPRMREDKGEREGGSRTAPTSESPDKS